MCDGCDARTGPCGAGPCLVPQCRPLGTAAGGMEMLAPPPPSDSPSKIWAAHWIHHVPSASIPFVPVVNLGPGVGRSFFPPPHPAHIRPSPPPVLQNASHSPKN